LFCSFGPSIEGFYQGVGHGLVFDPTALNGRWDGNLAAATSVDGHNYMYPVAYGFIDMETEGNWKWYMT
jgi:hypothetical protein